MGVLWTSRLRLHAITVSASLPVAFFFSPSPHLSVWPDTHTHTGIPSPFPHVSLSLHHRHHSLCTPAAAFFFSGSARSAPPPCVCVYVCVCVFETVYARRRAARAVLLVCLPPPYNGWVSGVLPHPVKKNMLRTQSQARIHV